MIKVINIELLLMIKYFIGLSIIHLYAYITLNDLNFKVKISNLHLNIQYFRGHLPVNFTLS